MFLPKSKYKGPFTATGGDNELLVKDTLQPYRGKYIVTYKNQYFEGETPQEAKKELIFKKDYEQSLKQDNNLRPLVAFNEGPSESDYKNKKYTRYFVKDLRKGKILEVNLKEFNTAKEYPAYSVLQLVWDLSKPADDTMYRGYLYIGSATKNQNTINESEKVMKGIKNYLKDPKEFVL